MRMIPKLRNWQNLWRKWGIFVIVFGTFLVLVVEKKAKYHKLAVIKTKQKLHKNKTSKSNRLFLVSHFKVVDSA